MTNTKPTYVNLSQVAAGLGLSKGRVSQLRRTPEFPPPHHRRGLIDVFDEQDIRDYAAQTARRYFSPHGPPEHEVDAGEWWMQPGRFTFRGVTEVNDVAWLVFEDATDRIVLRFYSETQAPQHAPVERALKPTWILEVASTWMPTSPEVVAESTAHSAVGGRTLIRLDDVARKLGLDAMPYLQRLVSPVATELMLARGVDGPFRITTKPTVPSLTPAYRLHAHAGDADIRAAAAAFINTCRNNDADSYQNEIFRADRNRGIKTVGEVAFWSEVPVDGDPGVGMEKIVYGLPHELEIDFVAEAAMWGKLDGRDGRRLISSYVHHQSQLLASLVTQTWTEVPPVAGHAFVMGPRMLTGATLTRFYEHPTTRDLAVVHEDFVSMTWKPRPLLSVSHLIFIEGVGVVFTDDDGIVGALSPAQEFGYRSGNIGTAVRAAGLVGVKFADPRDLERTQLCHRLNAETLALNTPIPAETVRELLTTRV